MVMRSLAFSVFILILCLSYTLINTLSNDIDISRNDTVGGRSLLRSATPKDDLTDLAWNNNPKNLSVFGLDDMANTQEIQGGSFGQVSATSILYKTLFYSTTGFDTFLRQILNINTDYWNGTTIVAMIDLMMVLVILNHGFVLIQLIMKTLGVF